MPAEPGNNALLEVRPSSLAGIPMHTKPRPAPKPMTVPSFEFSCGDARRRGYLPSGSGQDLTTNAAEDAEITTLERVMEQP